MKEKNLEIIEKILPERLHSFIEGYRRLAILYATVCRTNMNSKDQRYDGKNEAEGKLEYLKESKHAIDNFIEIIDYNKFGFKLNSKKLL